MPAELNQFDQRRALEQLKTEAKKKCTAEFEAFVNCSRGSLGAVTHCKPLFNTLNDCLKQHTTEENHHRIKLELLKEKEAKLNSP